MNEFRANVLINGGTHVRSILAMAKQYVNMEAEGLSQNWSSFYDDIKSYHKKYTVLSNSTLQLNTTVKRCINEDEIFQLKTRNIADDSWRLALNRFALVLDSFQSGFTLILNRLEIIQELERFLTSSGFTVQHIEMVEYQLVDITKLCSIFMICIDVASFLLES